MTYKTTVEEIITLPWETLTAQQLQQKMIFSVYTAREFAESLRIAKIMHPQDTNIQQLVAEELQTDNLWFDDYDGIGDHADFLEHFISKHELMSCISPRLATAIYSYVQNTERLDKDVRSMSIFSREAELPKIFPRILSAPDWDAQGLDAYRHYLERHVALDSSEGGHADLVSAMIVDERVAQFWEIRQKLYDELFKSI